MNPIATMIAESVLSWVRPGRTLIVGVCGTQASGKSTACEQVVQFLEAQGLTAGVLGLDDLYLGRKARAELALNVHPLFATRGPPGTHDVTLGSAVVDAVLRGEAVQLPRFDKRADEPIPRDAWPELPANCDVLLFEGWCVGAKAQEGEALIEPVNELERKEDENGLWRRTFNAHLAGPTADLFARIDRLIYLRPPGFEIVHTWRCEQEHAYLKTDRAEGAPAAMSDDQVTRFIAHYERITRHIIAEMSERADLTLQLDSLRNPISIIAQK
jgi:D-glycerate 3-kinase